MDRYQNMVTMIDEARNNEVVNFNTVNGVSEEWIEKAEARLGFSLPETYKWWLRTYGVGSIYDDEIFGIYQMEWGSFNGGDIVNQYEIDKKNGMDPNKLRISSQGFDYYFDLSDKDVKNSEYPVRLSNNDEIYAKDFLEFLQRQITEDTYYM